MLSKSEESAAHVSLLVSAHLELGCDLCSLQMIVMQLHERGGAPQYLNGIMQTEYTRSTELGQYPTDKGISGICPIAVQRHDILTPPSELFETLYSHDAGILESESQKRGSAKDLERRLASSRTISSSWMLICSVLTYQLAIFLTF